MKYNLSNDDIKKFFTQCCEKDNLNELNCFLNENLDFKLSFCKSKIIRTACIYGAINIVKFLLLNDKYSKQINIHAKNDEAFRLAVKFGNKHIVEFLILDFKIEKTKSIEEFLNQKIDNYSINLFNNRLLKESLDVNLPKNKHKKKIKV